MKNYYYVSGGKDSTAMLLHALELGEQVDAAIFLDTTLEFPQLYAYLDKVDTHLKEYDLKIDRVVTSKHPFEHGFYRVRQKGPRTGTIQGFPFAGFSKMCWIRRDFKAFPKPGEDHCHLIGIAYDERHRTNRKTYTEEVECVGCAPFSDQCNTLTTQVSKHYRFPLIEWKWTEADCIKYLEERDLLNPLYSRFRRIGCWLCPYQGKESLYQLYLNYPNYWHQLLKYEKDSPQGFLVKGSLSELEPDFNRRAAVTQLTL
jgi:3'-phosphoadenosine 5'-phosphosulfate sulfotransferase (PAPS reductase)/FAD synthetase